MTDPADKAVRNIQDALAALGERPAAKGADMGAVASMPDRTGENIARWRGIGAKAAAAKAPPNPVEHCLALCEAALDAGPEPIRTIHHLSCTGGTLIAKCIASMPNVLLLNEVDPLSPLPFKSGKPAFTPTDMIALLRQGDKDISEDLIERLFVQNLETVRDEMAKTGRSLILRDHSHSHFLTGDAVPERPALRDMLARHFPLRSIVTVRDPIDSYLSMKKQGWYEHFSPPTFDEYCRRYLIFLKKYEGVNLVKYEDFVADPPLIMKRICAVLELDYSDIFLKVFDVFRFSGDSGRSGGVIEARPRRDVGSEVGNIRASSSCCELVEQLGFMMVR